MKRYGVNKAQSARVFRGKVARTKMVNITRPMSGGIRL